MLYTATLCARCEESRHPGPMNPRPGTICEACGDARARTRDVDLDADYVDYAYFHGPVGWLRSGRPEETVDRCKNG